jgi:hypothetical protein
MLNVLKYDHLCENVTFIGYLCEICSMCENMTIWYLGSIFEVHAISKVLCSISDGHYTESGNSSVFDEEKGRHAHETHISYLRRRETCTSNAHLVSQELASFCSAKQKIINRKFYTGCLQSCMVLMPVWTRAACNSGGAECRISYFQSSRPSDWRMFKS